MLKIIFRTLCILLAAGLICAGLYLYANNAGASLSSLPGGETHERPQFDGAQDLTTASRPEGALRGEGHDREGASLFAFTGILVNFSKVAVITAFVILIQWIVGKVRRRAPQMAGQ